MDKNQLLLQMSYCIKTAINSKALSLKYKVRQCRLHRAKTFIVQSTLQKANTVSFTVQLYFAVQIQFLQSNRVKRTPQDAINELNIQKLNPLEVVNFRSISAFLHV